MWVRPVLAAALAGCLAAAGCTAGPIPVATLTPDSLTDGLIAHWSLDEGTGAVANDGSGNGRLGLVSGSSWSWLVPGQFGSALHFGGADDMSAAGIPAPTASYSVALWVLVLPSELGSLVANLISTETTGGGWSIYATYATLGGPPSAYAFRYATDTPESYTVASCACVTPGAWTHLAAVLDGDAETLTLYVNGVPTSAVPATAAILPGSSVLYLARSAALTPPFPLEGALDDVGIWARALAPEEIAALTGAPIPDPM